MMDPSGQLTLEQQQLLNQMHNHAAFQHQMDSQSMATTTCIYCSTQLSYPHNSIFIQCPKCSNTMNPQAPQTNYMNCIGCGTLLSHPPSSLTIQCPKCLMIMNLQSVRNNNTTPSTNNLSNEHSTHDAPSNSSQADHDNHSDDGNNKKSRKKRKDPNAPKRASNAYMIFCKERRAQLKEDRPDLQFGKLGARLGEIWRQMSPDEKKPYENRASSDRERYKKEMTSYQAHSMIKQQAGHMGTPGEDDDNDDVGSDEEVEEQNGEPTKRRKHSHQEGDSGQYQQSPPQQQQHGSNSNLDERALAQFQYNLMAHDPSLLQQTMALQLQQQQQQLQHLSYAYQQQQQQQLQHQLQQHTE